jgi:phage terminase large subunit GpA-like protein
MNIVEDVEVPCPHCGEIFAIEVDTAGGDLTMVEDCAVCCRPMTIAIRCEPGEVQSVDISPA